MVIWLLMGGKNLLKIKPLIILQITNVMWTHVSYVTSIKAGSNEKESDAAGAAAVEASAGAAVQNCFFSLHLIH